MESTPARNPAPAQRGATAPASPDVDKAKAEKEATDKAIAERIASPPEQPTPTQAEADAIKSGEALAETKSGTPQEREVRPGTPAAGYTTR
jgi:hypothetical protein